MHDLSPVLSFGSWASCPLTFSATRPSGHVELNIVPTKAADGVSVDLLPQANGIAPEPPGAFSSIYDLNPDQKPITDIASDGATPGLRRQARSKRGSRGIPTLKQTAQRRFT
jgi:hypothetical protein